MEKKKRLSRKQKLENELKQKKEQLHVEFRDEVSRCYELFETDEKGLKELGVYPDEELWTKAQLEKFQLEQTIVLSGTFQEPDEIRVIYQQKFVQAIQDTSLHILEELRPLVKNFKALFGITSSDEDIKEILNKISDLKEKFSKSLFSLYFISTEKVFRENDWLLYKVPLQLTKYFLDVESAGNKETIPVPDAVKTWHNKIKATYISNHNLEYDKPLTEALKDIIISAFHDTQLSNDLILENFLTLKCKLLDWMERYNLQRNFLLLNAYIFLGQYSQNEKMAIQDLKIWRKLYYSLLQADEFTFKTKGWWAREEKAEDYKKRVSKEFKEQLSKYLEAAYFNLDLSNKTHITKPKDPDFESIYWLIAWNEGATYKQIANIFNRSFYAIKDGIDSLRKYGLPKRQDTPGRKKFYPLSEDRIQEIQNCFLIPKKK